MSTADEFNEAMTAFSLSMTSMDWEAFAREATFLFDASGKTVCVRTQGVHFIGFRQRLQGEPLTQGECYVHYARMLEDSSLLDEIISGEFGDQGQIVFRDSQGREPGTAGFIRPVHLNVHCDLGIIDCLFETIRLAIE